MMHLNIAIISVGFIIATCSGALTETSMNNPLPRLSDAIGNFSIELLYRTTYAQEKQSNLIISPITVWSVLAVIAEGASDETLKQIQTAIRIPAKAKRGDLVSQFQSLEQFLVVNTSTVVLQKLNALFLDTEKQPRKEFIETAKTYETRMIPVSFSNAEATSKSINTLISDVTRGQIPEMVTASDISDASLLLTSAVYFKGQWTMPFNASHTSKSNFFDSNGKKLGEVNMMYNKYTYPFASVKRLEAKVLELPYGTQNRLSMLIMLPDNGVSLENMFRNFASVSLDYLFLELKKAQEDFGDDEVDCFIPRFQIETSLSLTDALFKMGIHDLFQENKARLPIMAMKPLYVSKFIHKATIEVTEEGTIAAAASASEFSNRIGALRFEANRPFCFLIIEKITNTIAFGGFYHTPSLF